MAAYMAVYKWYTSTSGQGVTDRMSKAMNPAPPKSDADLANAIERWEENLKQLEAMGEGYNLMTEFRKTALGRLMSGGQAKSIYEQIMITGGTYEAILNKCKEYAQLRRQEHNHKKHREDMDLDEVGEFSEKEEHWHEERGDNLWEWDLNQGGKGTTTQAAWSTSTVRAKASPKAKASKERDTAREDTKEASRDSRDRTGK